MKAFVSPEGGSAGEVALESRAAVYRDPDRGQEVAVETGGTVRHLGVADATVSRKKGEEPPVVLEPRSECVVVRNEGNANGVTVRTEGDETDVEEGFGVRVRRDAVVEVGYQTTLHVTVEREAREEYVIEGGVDADGDVVMGDQTTVDNRTSVEDVVAKDLDVSGEGAADVRDAVASDVDVGGDAGTDADAGDTRSVCSEHGVAYTGPECPECAAADATTDRATGGEKYCLFCGESIPGVARVCPACGEDLPDA